MGRPKKTEEGMQTEEGVVTTPTNDSLDKLRKMRDSFLSVAKTDTGNILKSSPFSNVRDWIPTGSYALNALISGSVYKGIPSGRMVALAGLNSVGKSYLTGTICREAQHKGYFPIYIDTENAVDDDFLKRLGVDTDLIYHDTMFVGEHIRNYIVNKIGEAIQKNKDLNPIICIDSLGNLSSLKDKEDVKKDKTNADMGSRAKSIKDLLKNIMHFIAPNQIPLIFTNHVYIDNSGWVPATKQSGGEQPMYMASAVLEMTATDLRNDDKEVIGRKLRIKCTKNRFRQPKDHVEILLSFKNGPNPYYGLERYAIEAGIFEEINSKTMFVKHLDAKMKIGEIFAKANCVKVFTPEILGQIDEHVQKNYCYAKVFNSDEMGEYVGDVEEEKVD